ncbi:hypothetical protein G6F22_021681 [Rhizopus arrhizus]|nr:hypothetical protein G6F22_021681 [Rhizopus arrhizus]
MELASAERGPMNAALGADLPVPESPLAALRAARGKTDAQIDQLLALASAPRCRWLGSRPPSCSPRRAPS